MDAQMILKNADFLSLLHKFNEIVERTPRDKITNSTAFLVAWYDLLEFCHQNNFAAYITIPADKNEKVRLDMSRLNEECENCRTEAGRLSKLLNIKLWKS